MIENLSTITENQLISENLETLYAFNFPTNEQKDICVYASDGEFNTVVFKDFTIKSYDSNRGGTLKLNSIPVGLKYLIIAQETEMTQHLSLSNQRFLNLGETEKALDKLTIFSQRLLTLVKQCVSAPVGVAVKGYEDFVAVYHLCKAEVIKASEQANIAQEQADRAKENVAQAMKDVVIDSLTSTDVTKPLSAKQGMVLNSYKAEKMNPNLNGHLISSLGSDGDVTALVGSETFQMRVSERNNGAQTFVFDREGPRFDLGGLGGGKTLRVDNSPVLVAWDVMDDLESNLKSNPLSANQGRLLKGFIDVKADIATTYLKTEVDTKLGVKADKVAMTTALNNKLNIANPAYGFSVDAYGVSRIKATENPFFSGVVCIDITHESLGRTISFVFSAGGLTMDNVKALFRSDVVNNLLSNSVDTPLSANMGKALNESKADSATTYLKTEVDTKLTVKADKVALDAKADKVALDAKADSATTYLKTEVDTKLGVKADKTALDAKADKVALDTKADSATTYLKTEVDTKLDTKADVATTYLKTEVDTKLGTKADKTALDAKADNVALDAKADKVALDTKADVATTYLKTEVDTKLGVKADKTALDAKADNVALDAKADKTALDAKADKTTTYLKTEVDTKLSTKADKVALDAKADSATTYLKTEVDTKLGVKADKTALDAKADKVALDTKADSATTYLKTEVDTKLDTKADVATTYLKTEVDTKLGTKADKTALDAKADSATTYLKTEVDAKLGTKADVATTYLKTEVDTKLGTKADKPAVATPSSNALTWTGTTWGAVPVGGFNSSSYSAPGFNVVASGGVMPLSDTDSVEYCYAHAGRSTFTLPNGQMGYKQILYLIKSDIGGAVISPSNANIIWEINGVAQSSNEMPDLSKTEVVYVILYDGLTSLIPGFPNQNMIILSLLCTINYTNQHTGGGN